MPVLSMTYYQDRIAGLLSVLKGYEDHIHTLDTQTAIADAIAQVSSALAKSASPRRRR